MIVLLIIVIAGILAAYALIGADRKLMEIRDQGSSYCYWDVNRVTVSGGYIEFQIEDGQPFAASGDTMWLVCLQKVLDKSI